MIGQLTGILISKQAPIIIIDVAGVGYECEAPMTTIFDLPELGETLTLFTHLHVREDAHQLYAFRTLQDRDLFRNLIKVSGIGAKMGLALLSGMDAQTVVSAILDHDTSMLVQIPGIGKKTAERLVVEMADRLSKWDMPSGALAYSTKEAALTSEDSAAQDAQHALISLGYKPGEASQLVRTITKENPGLSSEMIIKQALKSAVKQ